MLGISLCQKVFLRPTLKRGFKKSYKLLTLIRKSTASSFYKKVYVHIHELPGKRM